MNVQSILHAIDGVSTWVGKAAAWLIIALMTVVCSPASETSSAARRDFPIPATP